MFLKTDLIKTKKEHIIPFFKTNQKLAKKGSW